MFNIYWVEFENGRKGTIKAKDANDAKRIGLSIVGCEAIEVNTLPYPAEPKLNAIDCPSFCFSPERCKGQTSCPRLYSCTE